HHDHEGDDQQDVDEPAHVEGEQSEQPQNQQDDRNRPQHKSAPIMSEDGMSTHGVSPNAKCNLPYRRVRCRCAESRPGAGLALAFAVILLGGCGGDAGDEEPEVPGVEYRRFVAVQVTSRPDSATAYLLRDSLVAAGWVA